MIEMEKVEGIRVLKMNHGPENRFSREFLQALNQALDELEKEEGCRAVILASKLEKYFSNGLDIGWLFKEPKEVWQEFLTSIDRLLLRVFLYPKPILSAINGHAFAGGLFLALATDYRLMREDKGWLCIPEIDLGIDFPPGSLALISYVIGLRNTDWITLTAQRLGPREALKLGLVDELLPLADLIPRALEAAKLLAQKPAAQYAKHKKNLRGSVAEIMEQKDPEMIRLFLETKLKS